MESLLAIYESFKIRQTGSGKAEDSRTFQLLVSLCVVQYTYFTLTLSVGVNSQYKRDAGCVVMLHIKSRLVPAKGCSVSVDDVVGGISARQPIYT